MTTYKRARALSNIIINHKSITLKPGTNSTKKSKTVDDAVTMTTTNLHKYRRRQITRKYGQIFALKQQPKM